MVTTKQPAKTAVVMCRTSTGQQAERDTIEAQKVTCRSIVQRLGVRLLSYGPAKDGWLVDDGQTGTLLEGRHFSTFIEDLRHGRLDAPDYLIVYSLSRIGRLDKVSRSVEKLIQSAKDNGTIKAVLMHTGIMVVDASGTHDPKSVTFEILLALANEEHRLIYERTKGGKARLVEKGRWPFGGNTVPYGYRQVFANGVDRKDSYILVEDPEKSAVLRQVLAWYASLGISQAARLATEAGLKVPDADIPPTKKKAKRRASDWTPTKWNTSTIGFLVDGARDYWQGTRSRKWTDAEGKNLDGVVQVPPLIDEPLYLAVERRKLERKPSKATEWLVTGYAQCGGCGAHVHCRNNTKLAYTACGHKTAPPERKNKACGYTRAASLDVRLWEATLGRLVQIRQHEQALAKEDNPYGAELKETEQALAKVSRDMEVLLDLHLTGGLDKAIWQARNASLNERKLASQDRIQAIKRKQETHSARRQNEQEVFTSIQTNLRQLGKGGVPLDRKRKVLGQLLNGGRLILTFRPGKAPLLTLPKWGGLAEVTLDTTEDPTFFLTGHTRDALGELYDVSETVTTVTPQRGKVNTHKAS